MVYNPTWPDQLKRLVICIGAQKAATSFVFDQLIDDPRVVTTPRKEVNFWNTRAGQVDPIWLKRSKSQYRRAQKMLPINFLRQGLRSVSKLREAKQMVDIRTGERKDKALQAYHQILLPTTPHQFSAFEATPAYALLPVDTFRQMAAFHPNLQILYILRDPIKRLWSDVAYSLRHDVAKGLATESDISTAFQSEIEEKNGEKYLHSNFPDTLARLSEAGLEKQVHVIFMETMTEQGELKMLEQALGFKPDLNFKREVNKNSHKPKLPHDLQQKAIEAMSPIYLDMRNRFGERIPESWLT